MSRIPRSDLAPVVTEIRQLIVERLNLKDDFMVTPAVIAELFGDRYLDSFNLKHAQAFHVGNVMAGVSDFLLNLHNALSAKGHGRSNKFEISSCDRYAAVIPYSNVEGRRLLAFESQNFTYMVLLVPDLMSRHYGDKKIKYQIHVRSSTLAAYGKRHIFNNPGIKGLPRNNAIAEHFDHHGGYFRYLDVRDRGFVASIVPEPTYRVMPNGEYEHSDKLEWTAKDAHSSIYGGLAMLDDLKAFSTMWQETFEELEYKVVDNPEVGE